MNHPITYLHLIIVVSIFIYLYGMITVYSWGTDNEYAM
jgi:hypothetical protein